MMYEKLMDLCERALRAKGAQVSRVRTDFIDLTLPNGEVYTVEIDETECEPEDNEGLDPNWLAPFELDNHTAILDCCLHALAQSEYRQLITDLSTDGDGDGCEAIFCLDDWGYTALKVR